MKGSKSAGISRGGRANDMKELFKKIVNRETIFYVVFGALTTLVNFVVFHVTDQLFERTVPVDLTHVSNSAAWITAVAFAYVTNKLFVFESKSWAPALVRKEVIGFAGARLLSFGFEELGLLLFINLCHFDRFVLSLGMIFAKSEKISALLAAHDLTDFAIGGKMMTKIGLSVVVLVLNYIFSKFVIFRKKQEDPKEDETA